MEVVAQKSADVDVRRLCFHCGTPCDENGFSTHEKAFCCQGCLTVFELLAENGLTDFYSLAENAGVRVKVRAKRDEFAFLDAPAIRERLVDFSNDKLTRVTFRIPAIHCIACVWLLENLFRLKAGIGQSHVHFPRKEVLITFQTDKIKLSEVVGLLASLGYEPDLKFSDLDRPKSSVPRQLWLQLGVAGFAFGNIMLLSISSYLGLDVEHFRKLFGYLSFTLSLPVVFYSASDYWKSSWRSLRRKLLTIEVPIAIGITAIFVQSSYEVFSGRGEGYFDSLCGLVFFLLCGRLFQQKTFDRLAFDRDFKSFFPLSVNGDGQGDIGMLYDAGSGTTKVFRFLSSGSAFSYDSITLTGYSMSQVDKHVVAGDANGDGKGDIVTAYQYSDGTFRYHVFLNGNSYQGAAGWYQSGSFNLNNVAGRMTMGTW